MCGICGYVSKEYISPDDLKIMNDTMYHRGPDDSGEEVFVDNGHNIGLAQRRLSILDLSPLGHQPMHSVDGRLSVVFNGEIYNYRKLKEELSDYHFISTCDTEVILAAYLKWGISMVDHINGMFAIAIYDRNESTLYLIRDRIGKKPLFYGLFNGGIYFASELKPLMTCPNLKLDINPSVIPRYIFQQYICGPDTIYKNVFKLSPGGVLSFRKGEVKTWKYWDIKSVYGKKSQELVSNFDEAKSGLKECLKEAVASRLIADVPVGTFLSGGYDSSLITAIAQSQSSSPIKTFCIGFDVPKYNEAVYAKEIAKYLGTDHTELYIETDQMYDLVESVSKYYDEPFADSSQIPSMLVSKLARKDVTVALSGDGGDELFCGYNIYDNVKQAQFLDKAGAIVNVLGKIGFSDKRLIDKMPFRVRVVASNRDPLTKTQIASDSYITAASHFLSDDIMAGHDIRPIKYPIEDTYNVANWQIRRMLLDMDTYLADDILVKMDRASMKYSLENRCPIMDTNVMEYSFRIPHEYKYNKGCKKYILKELAYDYIPREMLERPKQGFGVPMDMWLRGPLREPLMEYSNPDYIKKQGLFNPVYVSSFIENYLSSGDAGPATGANYSKLVWAYYIFQQWYEFSLKQSTH
ncbi:MAG: asparagine synthase (glutamine-hydrolyzing) [Lachnospiraceae bacterium]|nr:asparagine synthase (glutamine-hydrolyzing) [Lachnospiraceae bacterium]